MYKNMKNNLTRNFMEQDFSILCSNCHRMIHKLPRPKNNKADLQTLKIYIKMLKLKICYSPLGYRVLSSSQRRF